MEGVDFPLSLLFELPDARMLGGEEVVLNQDPGCEVKPDFGRMDGKGLGRSCLGSESGVPPLWLHPTPPPNRPPSKGETVPIPKFGIPARLRRFRSPFDKFHSA